MKTYIGTKIIQAEPMDGITFSKKEGKSWSENEETRPGYRVVSPDGYVSWSPEETFDLSHREITREEFVLVLESEVSKFTHDEKQNA